MTVSARERGAALVLVLVFTTAMAAAAVAFLAGRRTDALTLRGQLQSVEADAMLSAALRETVVVLANRTPRQVIPAQLQWTLDDVAVLVQIERESGKIDLNKAPGSLLVTCKATGNRAVNHPTVRARFKLSSSASRP